MSNEIQFILYHLPDEDGKVQVVIKDETIWAFLASFQRGNRQPPGSPVSHLYCHFNLSLE